MPHQGQSLTDTLIAYTRDAAYAEFQEQQKGQIREGYLADLVLLPKNIFEIPSIDIADLKPSLTMVDGNIAYEA
jgi:predicted amidohydrolase YtcJ